VAKLDAGVLAATSGPGGRMTLVSHLRELRYRVLVSLAAFVVGVAVAYVFWEPIYDVLRQPYCSTTPGKKSCDLYTVGIFDQFQIRTRVAFLAGAVLSAPIWTFHIGRFITPGLHRNERRYAFWFMGAGMVLFSAGVSLAYLTVARGLELFLSVGGGHVVPLVTLGSYLSFLTLLLLAFGLAFEFPLLVLFLNFTGVISSAAMRKHRRPVIFGIFIISAVLVPTTDPFTFLAMGVPLAALFEACIVIARVRDRKRAREVRELDAFEAGLYAELGLKDVSAGL
jgi:sec-independent protein translocase protein TatC